MSVQVTEFKTASYLFSFPNDWWYLIRAAEITSYLRYTFNYLINLLVVLEITILSLRVSQHFQMPGMPESNVTLKHAHVTMPKAWKSALLELLTMKNGRQFSRYFRRFA